jgi:hypothetical protein
MYQSPRIDEIAPGACGLLMDETPILLASNVKPYVIAILLHRGAVRRHEIQASLVPHCSTSDLKVGGWDPFNEDYCENTRLEELIDEALGDFVSEGILRYNESQDFWVLTGDNISTIISWAAATGAKLPQHLTMELTNKRFNRIPDYVKPDYATNQEVKV